MPSNAYGEVRATQLTSIVAQGNNTITVEVRQRPPEAKWRYRLDVIADNRQLFFDRPSLKFQHFRGNCLNNINKCRRWIWFVIISGVTIYTPTYTLNQSEVIIMFDNGAGVEVIDNQGYMTARVYLPWSFIVSIFSTILIIT